MGDSFESALGGVYKDQAVDPDYSCDATIPWNGEHEVGDVIGHEGAMYAVIYVGRDENIVRLHRIHPERQGSFRREP